VQFTAPSKELGVANRDLGTVVRLEDGQMTLRMDGKSAHMVTFETAKFRQFDLGYAVTSHSSQGLTAGRVLVHIDTDSPRSLINNRLAYVSISRASDEARIYTNDAAALGERLAFDVTKKAAVAGKESPTNVLRSEDFNRKPAPPKILATGTEELGISL
jgi:ATP-dependent exoDNAse (exonuclease V) alpha subunit